MTERQANPSRRARKIPPGTPTVDIKIKATLAEQQDIKKLAEKHRVSPAELMIGATLNPKRGITQAEAQTLMADLDETRQMIGKKIRKLTELVESGVLDPDDKAIIVELIEDEKALNRRLFNTVEKLI